MSKKYEIKIRGRVSDSLVRSLGAQRKARSETALVVEFQDRSAMHGFICNLENLGLELVSLAPDVDPDDEGSDDDP